MIINDSEWHFLEEVLWTFPIRVPPQLVAMLIQEINSLKSRQERRMERMREEEGQEWKIEMSDKKTN